MIVIQTVSHEGRQSSSYHYLNLPQDNVHTFKINALQINIRFLHTMLKEGVGNFGSAHCI